MPSVFRVFCGRRKYIRSRWVQVCLWTMGFLYILMMMQNQDGMDPLQLIPQNSETDMLQSSLPAPGEEILLHPSTDEKATFVVLVMTSPEGFHRRSQVRSTWGNSSFYKDFQIKAIFVVGKTTDAQQSDQILHEAKRYDDILLVNILDTYKLLVLKVLIAMKWVARNLKEVQFVMKTDDDMILNTFKFYSVVQELKRHKQRCFIVGHLRKIPLVDRFGKHSVSVSQYSYLRYPTYCYGSAYLLSKDAMLAILEATNYLPMFPIEDVFFCGILAGAMNVTLWTAPRRTLILHTQKSNIADFQGPILALHHQTNSTWKTAWDTFKDQYHQRRNFSIKFKRVDRIHHYGLYLKSLSQTLNKPLFHDCRYSNLTTDLNSVVV